MSNSKMTLMAIILVGIISLCTILIINKVFGRARIADITQYKLYTLSDGTKNIVRKLNQRITLKLYYSKVAARKGPEQIRYWNEYFLYVKELLEEYAKLSNGKIKLKVIDPRPYSDEEEEAIKEGLKKFQLSEDETFFFGLVASNELGKTKNIPFFDPKRQEFVEYDMSKIISDLVHKDKKHIGILSSLNVIGDDISPYLAQMMRMQGKTPENGWNIVKQLKETYSISKVDAKDGKIAKDIDFLIVIHPKKLEKSQLFAIDQFVMKGGKLIVFEDPYCMADRPKNSSNPYAAMGYDSSSNLNSLLEKWGVTMKKGEIAVDRSLAQIVQLRRNSPPQRFMPYIALNDECFNRNEVESANLHDIKMIYSGILQKTKSNNKVIPILTTTKKGNIWRPSGVYEMMMPNPGKLESTIADGTKEIMIACRLQGKFKSNYPNGIDIEKKIEPKNGNKDKKKVKTEKKHLDALTECKDNNSIIVVADVDMITNSMAYQDTIFGTAQVGDNASFVMNSIDLLSGAKDLILVRTRGNYSRPFKVIDAIKANAEKATQQEIADINKKISAYRSQLQQIGQNGDNPNLINSEALKKRKEIEESIRKANKQLRHLQEKKRKSVESLEFRLKLINLLITPSIILFIAVLLAGLRVKKAKAYISRRAE